MKEQVAKMFGVTERTIINWENGRKIPSSKFDMVADFVSGRGAAGVPAPTDMSGFIPIIHADICAGNGNISFSSESKIMTLHIIYIYIKEAFLNLS